MEADNWRSQMRLCVRVYVCAHLYIYIRLVGVSVAPSLYVCVCVCEPVFVLYILGYI